MILASASLVSLTLSVLAATAYAWVALRASHHSVNAARNGVIAAWVLHGAVLAWSLMGVTAHFGFAPPLPVTAWLVAAVYAVETKFFPQLRTRWTLAALGSFTVVLALLFPGAPLSATASLWLPLHLLFGVACYGLFGTAVVHAWFMTRAEARIRQAADPHSGLPLLTLERLTYRFVGAGFVLLSASLVLGYGFSDAIPGSMHAWRWDHKTLFSLLAWITFAALLAGRYQFGWRGKQANRMLYTGTVFLLLAYVGSRFVLEVVLGRSA